MKLGRKVGNTRSIRGEDLFFFSFRDQHDFGRKIRKSEIDSKRRPSFFRDQHDLGRMLAYTYWGRTKIYFKMGSPNKKV